MTNEIFWGQSADPTVQFYDIQTSDSARGPWTDLAAVTGSVPGPNYKNGEFFYIDTVSRYNTWYRIIAVDILGAQGEPSVPFQANGTSPHFMPGATPFGTFDEDPDFQIDADKIVNFTRLKLGDPVMETHISSSQIYASFEEAAMEYSAIINQYQARSLLTSFLGGPTGTLNGSEQKYVTQNLEFEKKMAEPYGDSGPLSVNTSLPVYSGSIDLHTGQQKYNLNSLFSSSLTGSNQKLVVKHIYHFSPLSAYRFFGTTSALNYLNNQFNFESFTPETVFYLLPIWEDILRGMQFKTSNTVRRSNYSYEIHGNELMVYPPPSNDMPLWITWQHPPDATQAATINGLVDSSGSAVKDNSYYGVSNLSNVPFGEIQYSQLNSISKQWIRKMAFALAKEVEGQIRSKMATIPIPNGDLTLNGPELVQDARAEQDRLREELKAMLEELTYDKLSAKEAEKAAALEQVIMRVPLGIYIG